MGETIRYKVMLEVSFIS